METNEIKTISSGDATQNASSAADFEQKFRHTIRHGSKFQIFRAILQDFCTDCSIQGFKFFYERKRHWTERGFWMVMFVIATCLSGYMICDLYKKWDSTPVIISLSEKATPVWKVPFPAVTICPEVKISAKMLNLTQTMHQIIDNARSNKGMFENITGEKIDHLIALTHICNTEILSNFDDVGRNLSDAALLREFNRISIKLNDSFLECNWHNRRATCSNLFRPILTEDGVCFTFNSLNSRDIYAEDVDPDLLSVTSHPNATHWDYEKGYTDCDDGISSLKSYPYRVLGTGTQNGMSLALFLDPDDLDYMCQGPVQGFKVVLHAPSEIPLPSKNYFHVPFDQEVLVSIKPIALATSKELHTYPPDRKLCIMGFENPLKLFKIYSQRHCELECTSNFMKEKCGCVSFSYPRDKNTPICGIKKLSCVDDIEHKMVEKIFLESLNKSTDANDKTCKCLPSCTSLDYDASISSAKYDAIKYLRAFDQTTIDLNYTKLAFASLNIYFNEKQFFKSKRAELYGTTKFLAECGGLLGLCIGVTALSFVEIFYYFTLRLAWTLRMYRCRKSGDVSNNSATSSTIKSP